MSFMCQDLQKIEQRGKPARVVRPYKKSPTALVSALTLLRYVVEARDRLDKGLLGQLLGSSVEPSSRVPISPGDLLSAPAMAHCAHSFQDEEGCRLRWFSALGCHASITISKVL